MNFIFALFLIPLYFSGLAILDVYFAFTHNFIGVFSLLIYRIVCFTCVSLMVGNYINKGDELGTAYVLYNLFFFIVLLVERATYYLF